MNWFDEQIRQRKLEDDQIFADALRDAAGAALGKQDFYMKDDRVLTGNALEKILRYYHLHYQEAPEGIDTLEEQMEYILHPQGMMYRRVKLTDGWNHDAVGAYLGFRRDNGSPLALVPAGFLGYRCYDIAAGDTYWVTKKTAQNIQTDAYCFYRPFAQTKLTLLALFRYIVGCLDASDFILIAGISLLTTLTGFLVPRLINLAFGPVLKSGNLSVLAALAVFLLCVRLSILLINTGGSLVSGCVQTRLQMNIESAVMMRVLSLPPDFFREYNSGEIASRMQSVNTLCSSLVNALPR